MKNYLIFSGVFFLLFSSCDPYYYIDYKVDNQSNGELEVIVDHQFNFQDTITISPKSTETIYSQEGLGGKVNKIYAEVDSLRFIISITQSTKNYKKNPQDKSLWDWEKGGSGGVSILTICSSDLE